MVSVGVSKLGVTQSVFVNPAVKIDSAYYCNVLHSQQLLLAISQISGKFFIFQQDSAPAHRARDTISLLEHDTSAFISPDLWPPNNPDLNLVDYNVWGIMQHRVYQTKVKYLDDLKHCLIDVWAGIQHSLTNNAINQWHKCLRTCVRARSRQMNTCSDSRISQTLQTLIHSVSQGSAAMSLRCSGICNSHFVANFVLSLAVKEF